MVGHDKAERINDPWKITICETCGALIYWYQSKEGKSYPVNVYSFADGFGIHRHKWITSCKYCKSFESCLEPGVENLCITCAYCTPAPEEKRRIGKYICVHEIYPSKTRPHYTKGLSTCRLYRRKE